MPVNDPTTPHTLMSLRPLTDTLPKIVFPQLKSPTAVSEAPAITSSHMTEEDPLVFADPQIGPK